MGFEKEASSSSHAISLPREDTPLMGGGESQHLSSQFKTFANVFIAIVGAGVLGLPYAFKKTGWALGSLMILSVAAVTYYCMMQLVSIRRKLESTQGFVKISSFGDLGFAVSGRFGRLAVDVMIVLSQAGFCASYLIFISNTLAHVFNNYTPPPAAPSSLKVQVLEETRAGIGALWDWISPKSFYIWACLPFQLGLNSIPTLTHLAPLSIFADVVELGTMGAVMVEDVAIFLQQKAAVRRAMGGLSVFFYGIGVCVYSFEGIGMVLPLEAEAKHKKEFGRVLGLSMAFIALIYGGFGVLGYLAFGEDTKGIITTNLGRGLVSHVVQLGLCINLFFTFPLMMNPVYEVAERRLCGGSYCAWLRWAMVLGISLVALMVPNFADFLSLVGSSVCCLLGYVLPAGFHWMVFKDEMDWRGAWLDASIILMGLIIAVSGTWSSLSEIFFNV